MFKSAIAAAILSTCVAFSVSAQEDPVVIELFTSQGCSSCPPADRLLHELVKRDDVIGLALHVDYWDYIGWEDEYAISDHTQRQRAYARNGGRSMIYTPQMVINGRHDVVGAQTQELERLITAHQTAAPAAEVKAERSGQEVTVRVTPVDLPAADTYDVRIVQYTPLRHASIRRGELAGHDLDYANVVDSWQMAGRWDGVNEQTFSVQLDSDLPAVILVQRAGHGPIIAAAKVQ